jgi:hypothetical protein
MLIFDKMPLLLDPDPHSKYGSGSRKAKSMQIHAYSGSQHFQRPWVIKIIKILLSPTYCPSEIIKGLSHEMDLAL